MKGRAIVSFVLVACVCILGLFMPQSTVGLHSGDPINGADTAWVMVAAALVLIMTPGLGFFYGGMASRKNIISTVFQSVVCLGVISLLWVFVGFSLCFGDSILCLIMLVMTQIPIFLQPFHWFCMQCFNSNLQLLHQL